MNEVKTSKKPLIYYYGIVLMLLGCHRRLSKEKCIVAYHEIGHALLATKQTNSASVQKFTINK